MTAHLLIAILPLADPATLFHWLIAAVKVVLFLIAAGLAMLVSYLLLRLVWRIRWLSQKQTNTIRLSNLGNVDSVFRVAAVSPDHQLNFNYIMDGASLPLLKAPPMPRPQPAPVGQEPAPSAQPAASPQGQPGGIDAQKAADAKQALTKSAQKAGDGIKQVGGLTGMAIDILATVGSLIPGSAGNAIKQRAASLKTQKNAVNSTFQQPAMKAQQFKHLQNQVDTLSGSVGVPAKGTIPHPSTPQNNADPSPAPVEAASSNSQNPRPQTVQPSFSDGLYSTYVQLPPLTPAKTHALELSIEPQRKYRGGSYVYWLYTQPIEQPNLPSEESLRPVKTVQKLAIRAIPPGYWVFSILLSSLIVVLNGVGLIYFYFWLARFLA